jgi:hypothetical protein
MSPQGLRCLVPLGAVQHQTASASVPCARDRCGPTTSPFGAASGDSRTAARIERSTPAMEAPARLCGGEYVSVVSTPSPYLKEKRQKVKKTPHNDHYGRTHNTHYIHNLLTTLDLLQRILR